MDVNNQVLLLENQICNFFRDSSVTCHFRYQEISDEKIILEIFTFNPVSKVNFLFYRLQATTYKTALTKIVTYLDSEIQKENKYLVNWTVKDPDIKRETKEPQEFKSIFLAGDIEEVMQKFYHGKKNKDNYLVSGVNLYEETVVATEKPLAETTSSPSSPSSSKS